MAEEKNTDTPTKPTPKETTKVEDAKGKDQPVLSPDEKAKQAADKIKQLEDMLKQKDKKIADLETDLKWSRSDFENFRKSTERRMESDKQAMQGKLLRDFLSFFDTFDKAMQTAKDIADQNGGMSDSLKKFFGGLSGLYKSLNDIIESRNLKRMSVLGKKFDYNFHEVMMQVEDPNLPEDTIVQAIQQGWMLNGKVLRPAMVAVSRKPAAKPAAPPADAAPAADADSNATNNKPGDDARA